MELGQFTYHVTKKTQTTLIHLSRRVTHYRVLEKFEHSELIIIHDVVPRKHFSIDSEARHYMYSDDFKITKKCFLVTDSGVWIMKN